MTVQIILYSVESSSQVRESENFNIEEKGSELIEQLKRGWENIGEIRKGGLQRHKNKETQGYRVKAF